MDKNYDFSGWATRANVRCTDGRTIKPDAFKNCDGKTVPLVWNHQHNDPANILGHALLKNMDNGVFAYCSFNDSEAGQLAKMLVKHGDISSLSILANNLKQTGGYVTHGVIREVSLVLAGANPEAGIIDIIEHSDDDDSVMMWFNEPIELKHADEGESESMSDNKEETLADIIKTLNSKQLDAVAAMIGSIIEATGYDIDKEGDEEMKHNVFDQTEKQNEDILSHDAITTIIGDAKRFGSMKESFLQHADTYGIEQIDYLLPDPKTMNASPDFIQRDIGWVKEVMNKVHRSPFSRVKSIFANITEEDARAKGYIKGKLKKEEVFSLLKRTTTPTTVYKKQKMDRDDVIDITDFDVVAWLKTEMRMMLDEELARAILVGDGRSPSSDDKINEQNIRPIWKDEALYTIKNIITLSSSATADEKANSFIRAAVKSRKDYKGSGNPTLYTTEDFLTDMLLLTDTTGRDIYDSVDKLAQKLRVSKIVTVPVMEGLVSEEGNTLAGIIVNLADYNIGADKGGAVNMFDDFDIDYNQQKYLIETRCSGALVKPYSAIAIEIKTN